MVGRLYLRLFLAASLVVGVDQLTKSWALENLDQPKDIISGVLTLRLTYNSGGAFGLMQGLPGLFLVATIAAAVVILVWVRHIDDARWIIPLGLVLGGGLGNVFDRVFRDTGGRVVDFIDFHVWPVFNVADSCIVIGVASIFLFGAGKDRTASDAKEEEVAG